MSHYYCPLCGCEGYTEITIPTDTEGLEACTGMYKCNGCSVMFADPDKFFIERKASKGDRAEDQYHFNVALPARPVAVGDAVACGPDGKYHPVEPDEVLRLITLGQEVIYVTGGPDANGRVTGVALTKENVSAYLATP